MKTDPSKTQMIESIEEKKDEEEDQQVVQISKPVEGSESVEIVEEVAASFEKRNGRSYSMHNTANKRLIN